MLGRNLKEDGDRLLAALTDSVSGFAEAKVNWFVGLRSGLIAKAENIVLVGATGRTDGSGLRVVIEIARTSAAQDFRSRWGALLTNRASRGREVGRISPGRRRGSLSHSRCREAERRISASSLLTHRASSSNLERLPRQPVSFVFDHTERLSPN
jgi:hypothetical protein